MSWSSLPAWSQNGRINNVVTIRSAYIFLAIHSIHLSQYLVDHLSAASPVWVGEVRNCI